MSCHIFCAPTYHLLQKRLFADILAGSRRGTLSSQWVLVPNSTIASRLRQVVSQELTTFGPVGGLRLMPLSNMVSRITRALLGTTAPRWSIQHDLLLMEAIQALPKGSILSRAASSGSGLPALKRTFLDLAEGGFSHEESDILSDLCDSGELGVSETEVIRLYQFWLEILAASGVGWQPIEMRKLADRINSASVSQIQSILELFENPNPLRLYGFYEFTDSNLQLISAFSEKIDIHIYMPYFQESGKAHPGYSFTERVIEELTYRTWGKVELLPLSRESTPVSRFFLDTFPEGKIGKPRSEITYQYASGVRAEVISAALQVHRWLNHGIPPEEILVIVPKLEGYYAAIRDLFQAFMIPVRILEQPVGTTSESRFVNIVEHLWWKGASSEWIFSILREFPEIVHQKNIDLNQFEKKMRKLSIPNAEAWKKLAISLKGKVGLVLGEVEFSSSEVEFLDEICSLLSEAPPRNLTPLQASEYLRLFSNWLGEPDVMNDLISDLERIGEIRGGLEFNWEILRSAIQHKFENAKSDSLSESGVLVGPLMRMRGLTARCTVLMGLNSFDFLSGIDEDPLLADIPRESLLRKAGYLGHRLPLKSRSVEEMTLLFLLLNTAAEFIHWVIPETDEAGKSAAPSPMIQRYLNAWEKEERGGSRKLSRIMRAPAGQASLLFSLDSCRGQFTPPEFLRLLENSGEIQVCPRDILERSELSYEKMPVSNRTFYSVTSLETLAKCPFRYWSERELRLQTLDQLTFQASVNSALWGSLVHSLLEKILNGAREESAPVDQYASRLTTMEIEEFLESSLQQFPVLDCLMPSFIRWDVRSRLLELANIFISDLQKQKNLRVRALEFRTSRRIAQASENSVSGIIDRIDQLTNQLHVTDYKSGRKPSKSGLNYEVKALFRLQSLLYPWIVAPEFQNLSARFAYLFFDRGEVLKIEPKKYFEADQVLEALFQILSEREFFPTSNQDYSDLGLEDLKPCSWCDFTAFCRRYDPQCERPAKSIVDRYPGKRGNLLEELLEN